MKSLYLHIGMPKAGSTSIQAGLRASREALLEKGFYYPEDLAPHNFTFYPLFLSNVENFPDWKQHLTFDEMPGAQLRYRNLWEKRFREVATDRWIISSELLSLLEASEILALRDWLTGFFGQVRIILYLRHPKGFFNSWIQQQIKNGNHWDSAEKRLREWIARIDYQNLVSRWQEAFGEEYVQVWPFDPGSLEEGGPFGDLVRHLHLQGLSIENIHQNPSIGLKSLSVLQSYNQKFPLLVDGEINPARGLCLRHIPDIVFEKADSSGDRLRVTFTPDEAERINRSMDFLNRRFEDRFAFERVTSGTGELDFMDFEEIGEEYFLRLINEFHRHIEHLMNVIDTQDEILEGQVNGPRPRIEDPTGPLLHGLSQETLNRFYRYSAKNHGWWTRFKSLKYYSRIKKSGKFDRTFYLKGRPGTAKALFNPLIHYLWYGLQENRDPSGEFSNWDYLIQNRSSWDEGLNPLVHWIREQKEGGA